MMSGKIVDTFRQAKAPSGKRKAVLRSASKEAKPEAVAAAHQAPSEAGCPHADEREALRQFDLTGRYGPCTGLTRLERWERAAKLGLDPPKEIRDILERQAPGSSQLANLWSGRV